jgi:hypothetical protein
MLLVVLLPELPGCSRLASSYVKSTLASLL